MKRCQSATHHKAGCRAGRPLCRWRRKAYSCNCEGVSWGRGSAPHRKGSSCGKYGCCRHHPEYAERMYAMLDEPVRRVG